ncbi:Carboxypeptidase [Pleurostoma richardsiae]|uniref:carboxypeptidase C n=1 Tax=Pleurostoma richardsiae TaxID=41990 RepID=A0AA38VJQ6_9PEZI|nr:Carboxypeptidase [Pleurostoma richardsiae]
MASTETTGLLRLTLQAMIFALAQRDLPVMYTLVIKIGISLFGLSRAVITRLMIRGPGGSSTAYGGLVELGPCLVQDANSTFYNPAAWNSNATVIFVDQPVGVGYSYSSLPVKSADEATDDMFQFLRIWFKAFPALQKVPFFIAGESFGGTWVPKLAERIVERQTSPIGQVVLSNTRSGFPTINLKGIMLGNTQVSQRHQWKGFYDTGCTGPDPLFNASACAIMQAQASRCEEMLDICNSISYDQVVCASVLQYCRERSVFFIADAGLNPYDFRKPCGDVPGCYVEGVLASEYMNSSKVRKALGAPDGKPFQLLDMAIYDAFLESGDVGKETMPQVTYLLNAGIDVLVYVGNKDWYCNAAGTRHWVQNMPWSGLAGFRAMEEEPWTVQSKVTGSVKSWSYLTFVEIFDAGHMSPMDKGPETLALVNAFMFKTPLSS